MEKQDNKIIAEKLESLDSLPEGYQPNLDSKWLLLEESLEANNKKMIYLNYKWLTIAALLVLITGFSFFQFDKEKVNVADKIKTLPAEKITPSESENVIPVAFAEVKKTSDKKNKSTKHIVAPDTKKEILPVEIIPKENITAGLTEIENVVAEIPKEKSKAKKSRYVQIDFEDPVSSVAQQAEADPENHNFSFKIHLSKSLQQTGNSYEGNSPVRIQRSF